MYSQYDALLYIKNSQYCGIKGEEADFLHILSGLKASAGAVVLSHNTNAVFVDGRYELAAKLSIDSTKFEIHSLSKKHIIDWIKTSIAPNSTIAFDPRFFSYKTIHAFKEELIEYNFVDINLDKLFNISSHKRKSQIISIPEEYSEEKFLSIYEIIKNYNLDSYLICEPTCVSWLLGKRDLETKNTPVILGYLLITKDHQKLLYVDNSYDLSYPSIDKLFTDLQKFSAVGGDFSEIPFFLKHHNLLNIKNPIPNFKCVKSDTEISNIKNITLEDSAAIINFIYWFEQQENLSELDCVNKIQNLRKYSSNFIGNSFDTVAAADEHSAIVHYSPTVDSNKIVKNILLLDSGGQYKYGTTDITRTLSKKTPSAQEKFYYTLVLKGHIAVALEKLQKGDSAESLDSLARRYLKQYQLDYNHSTGHGIGYMLNVHEGPIAISKNNQIPLQANMLLSNEPGVYIENNIGIRLENMILTKEINGQIAFDTISLVPFDTKFIEFQFLDKNEKNWLKKYNEQVLTNPFLENSIKNWLYSYITTN